MTILMFLGGLILLVAGAEVLVNGAGRLAAALGISPLVIGLTVVAFGTSSPEMSVSVKAALAGQADIALGNVIGSNIFNVLCILGLSASITPLVVSQHLIRLDVPLMIGASLSLWLAAFDGGIGWAEGALLFSGLVLYIWFLIRQGHQETQTEETAWPAQVSGKWHWLKSGGLAVVGLLLLVVGSQWLVDSAVAIAHYLGVSELVIGLTVVAAGTSLPELATSAVAALRGERDIAVGNIVGSNLFNILGVMGLASIVAPGGVSIPTAVIRFDIPVMIGVALVCLPIFFTGGIISRREGVLLLGYQVVYTVYLVVSTAGSGWLPLFAMVVLYGLLPLTAVYLVLSTVRAWRGSLIGSAKL